MPKKFLVGPSIGHFTTLTLIKKKTLSYFKSLKKNNINFLQIFIDFDSEQGNINENTKKFKKFLNDTKLKVVVHSSYKHNMSKKWDKNSWWIKNTIKEIKFASKIGALGVVIHTGKQVKLSLNQAINNMYMAILHIHMITTKYNQVKIIIETPVGQGSELFSKIEDFGSFYKKLLNIEQLQNRMGICIDTCHIFAAGYDISTEDKFLVFINKFDKIIGIDKIALLHLNDSFHDLNSRIDRHQTIGNGYIGIKSLKYIADYFKNINIPIVLETPTDEWIKEVNKIL